MKLYIATGWVAMVYSQSMDDKEKRFRRATLRLIAARLLLGFWIGLGVGYVIAYYTIDRVVVVSVGPGTKV